MKLFAQYVKNCPCQIDTKFDAGMMPSAPVLQNCIQITIRLYSSGTMNSLKSEQLFVPFRFVVLFLPCWLFKGPLFKCLFMFGYSSQDLNSKLKVCYSSHQSNLKQTYFIFNNRYRLNKPKKQNIFNF